MLNCMHSFCKECLKKSSEEKGSQTSLNCPQCSMLTPLPAGGKIDLLPKDLRSSYEADVAKYESKVKSKKSIMCDRCVDSDNGPAISFCCNCCEFLCKICTKDHKSWRKTLDHELIMLGDSKKGKLSVLKNIPHAPMNCNVHPDESLKFFCESHRTLTCRDCVMLEHKECQYKRIETVAEKEKDSLLSVIGDAQQAKGKLEDSIGQGEKTIQRVQVSQKSVDDSIKSTFQSLYETLRSREKRLLSTSSDIALGKIAALQIQLDNLKEFRDEVTAVCIRVTSAAEDYTAAEMLSTKASMNTKLEHLLKRFQESILDPCKSDIMPLSLDSTALLKDIESFGEVIAGCSPPMSTATIGNIPKAIMGRERKFVITTSDAQGKPYSRGEEPVRATLHLMGSDDSPLILVATDNQDGTYSTSFTAAKCGEHLLAITVSNEAIKGSPFIINIRQPRDYTALNSSLCTFSVPTNVRGVAVDGSGNVYVAVEDHSVLMFDQNGTKKHTFGTPGSSGSENEKFYNPCAIALRGEVMYVTDENNHRVQKLTTSGEFLSRFGSNGSGHGQLSTPRGICINPEGKIFVAEYSNHRVSVFDADGTFLYHIVGKSSEGGEMKNPWEIAFDPEGHLHVANYSQNVVKVYSQDGNYLSQYGSGKLSNNSSGICVDEEGYSFVCNYASSPNRVDIFDPEHKHIKSIPNLSSPWGLALDNDGFLYVADRGNNRVLKY